MKNHLQNHGDTLLQFLWGIQTEGLGSAEGIFCGTKVPLFRYRMVPPSYKLVYKPH